MSDVASLVCWRCSLVLNLGWFRQSAEPRRIVTERGPGAQDPLATAALWKFLAEHVYHPVELAGEQSPPWDVVDEDFTAIDGDLPGAPTLQQYVDDTWPGRTLLLSPRPVTGAVRTVLDRLQEAYDDHRWIDSDEDSASIQRLAPHTGWPPPAAQQVDDDTVLARAAAVRDAVGTITALGDPDPLGASLPRALHELAAILAPAISLPVEALLSADRGDLAPPSLFDAERALGLVGKFLEDLRFSITDKA
jgi:hypothetical protein